MGTKKEALNYKQHGEPSNPSTPPPYSKKIKVKDIERDVDYTRSHMDDVIDELAERLHPRQLVHDFVDILTAAPHTPEARKVSHTARDTFSYLGEKMRHDPLPFAVIGAGITWLALSGRHHDENGRQATGFEQHAQPPLSHAAEAPEMRQSTPEMQDFRQEEKDVAGTEANIGDKAKEKAHQTGDYVIGKSSQAKDFISDKASGTRESLGRQARHGAQEISHLASQARHQADSTAQATSHGLSQTGNAFMHSVESNPLAAGAVALGAGALIGMLLPHTHTEDRYLHNASERTRENLAHKAGQATEAGKRIAAAAAASANQEAHKQGIAPEQVAEQASRRSEEQPTSPTADNPVQKARRAMESGAEAAKDQSREEKQKYTGESPS